MEAMSSNFETMKASVPGNQPLPGMRAMGASLWSTL